MMKKARLPALLALLFLTACGAPAAQEPTAPPSGQEAPATLESLCGPDYAGYIAETILMQMENRMEKTPKVVYFPIADDAPLTDYAAIDATTSFQVDREGVLTVLLPASAVTDAVHGQQSFRIPFPAS